MNYSKVFQAGHVVHTPEVKFAPSGTAVCEFRLATNSDWTSKGGEKKEEKCFIDVVFFGKDAESVGKYVTKGAGVMVEGRLGFDEWDDKATGKKRNKHKIIGQKWLFTGPKPAGEPRQRVERDVPQPAEARIDDDSALPF